MSVSSAHLVLATLLSFLVLFQWRECVGSSTNNDAADSNVFGCSSDSHCEAQLGRRSKCRPNGFCSNPQHLFEGGCLYQRLPGWEKKRVCNSDDPPNAEELGICRTGDFDYMEIRIASQNWESVFFEAYLLQILLSELLDVPTTIETGVPDAKLNLYDPAMPFDYGINSDYDGLQRAAEIGDCRGASRDPDHYESCAHVLPEDWEGRNNWVMERVREGLLEPPQGLAVVGQESWYIPKFAMRRDPSLATYLGLQGEQNRQKLADFFLRPTKWKDYCDTVSPDNCAKPDGVAQRSPADDEEGGVYFAQDLYTGYFRRTDENDCDQNPTTCTGHVVDYPCGWSSNTQQNAKHLNIALESNGDEPGSGGYAYSEMVQIIKASNATKSNIIVQWWTPETLFSQLLGSDGELLRVALPSSTQTCVNARVDKSDLCSDNETVRTGSPAGACDEDPHPLHKLVLRTLYDAVYDDSILEGSRSPAYDAIKLWSINNLQLGEIFEYWYTRQAAGGTAGQTAREAICDWVVDHMPYLQDFVPRTYPRVLHETNFDALRFASVTVAGIATLVVLFTAWMVFVQRKRRVMRVAQVEFLWLVLAGLLILSLGALIAVFATDGACVVAMWFVNFGYTLELVPLIVKVAAINRLMNAATNMRRVVLRRQSLFGAVAVINGFVAVLLVVWNALDAPVRAPEYRLSDFVTEQGDTVVSTSFYCSSTSNIWRYILVSVNAVLLLWATVLAFQSRKLRQDFNESMTLAIMIYSHALFLVLRLITFFLEGNVSNSILQHCQSLIFSVDTIATVVIYFLPKFATTDGAHRESMKGYHVYLRRFMQPGNWGSSAESDYQSSASGFMSKNFVADSSYMSKSFATDNSMSRQFFPAGTRQPNGHDERRSSCTQNVSTTTDGGMDNQSEPRDRTSLASALELERIQGVEPIEEVTEATLEAQRIQEVPACTFDCSDVEKSHVSSTVSTDDASQSSSALPKSSRIVQRRFSDGSIDFGRARGLLCSEEANGCPTTGDVPPPMMIIRKRSLLYRRALTLGEETPLLYRALLIKAAKEVAACSGGAAPSNADEVGDRERQEESASPRPRRGEADIFAADELHLLKVRCRCAQSDGKLVNLDELVDKMVDNFERLTEEEVPAFSTTSLRASDQQEPHDGAPFEKHHHTCTSPPLSASC